MVNYRFAMIDQRIHLINLTNRSKLDLILREENLGIRLSSKLELLISVFKHTQIECF